jgi:methylglutaconyl-CoA hydratase
MVLALLRRAVGEKKAFELITLGARFTAVEGQRIGLVARTFPAHQFASACLDFARDLASRSASALELCKQLLYDTDGLSFRQAVERGAEINVRVRATPDFREGVRRFLERRRR